MLESNSTKFRGGYVPGLASRWIRYVLGFSVSIALGLAPYLGKISVPLFVPMLSLIPESLQDVALPLSSASMGIVAILVQWYGSNGVSSKKVHKWFVYTFFMCISALVVLIVIEMLCVVRVDVPAAKGTATFAVGPLHPHTPPCETVGRAECISKKLRSLDEARIDSYFGEAQVNITKLLLVISYTAFMSCFGSLVGLWMLSQKNIRRTNRQ